VTAGPPPHLSATTERAAERRQLDLFLDGRDAFLVHEVHLFQAEDEVRAAGIAARVFRHLLSILPLESQGLSDLLVRERRALQQLSQGFFRYYMGVVGQRRLRT